MRGLRVGFVPTMGCLHRGHLSLLKRARRAVPKPGKIVASIYVNPIQFGPSEDFSKYPRALAADAAKAAAEDVDVLFVPSSKEVFPASREQAFSTYVVETSLSEEMEGVARPGHLRGVATILAKLFNIVTPDAAVFGEKDFQQAVVVRRMVRDLDFPVNVLLAPTVRERDGLAMSSRNQYLSTSEREQAAVLFEAIETARKRVREASSTISAARLRQRLLRLIGRQPSVRVDYVALIDPISLRAVNRVGRGTHLAIAAFVGRTRLIDNGRL